MLFNSLEFVVFFPLVTVLYFLTPLRFRWVLLLAASYYFYMSWRAEYAVLIALSTSVDYVAGRVLGASENGRVRKACLATSIAINLGILFFFKYFNFVNESARSLVEAYGQPYPFEALAVALPVGISFYTFQSMSYTIDVYRRVRPVERHPGVYALYVSYFPQLVAGPIERSTHLLPQFFRRHTFDFERMRSGLLLILIGFFKKLVIADRLAAYVDPVYNDPAAYGGATIILATYFFAFQIFCDFSGYSDIAIGAARVMGFDLMENFRRPYFARSTGEFWRRWHISLSTWMRDYLYISLGGNRISPSRTYVNIFLVFLLSGLWHGANWTFLAWGALHGVYLIVGRATGDLRRSLFARFSLDPDGRAACWLQMLVTFHLVVFAWVFFRANSLTDASVLIQRAFTGVSLAESAIYGPVDSFTFWCGVIAILVLLVFQVFEERQPIEPRVFGLVLPLRWAAYCALIFTILIFGAFTSHEFIYFQF
jgi:D-alanyl-lipoteichoic acid acyltransferase DltB (MBOAT superfamily)